MYFSKDADAIPTFEFPGSTGDGPQELWFTNLVQLDTVQAFCSLPNQKLCKVLADMKEMCVHVLKMETVEITTVST